MGAGRREGGTDCAPLWLSSSGETRFFFLLVSREFHHERTISIRDLWAAERMIFLMAVFCFVCLFVLSLTFYDEVMGEIFKNTEVERMQTPISPPASVYNYCFMY